MPVMYSFKCPICDFELESGDKDSVFICTNDGHEEAMKRVWSAPGISFKGAGFYKNDKAK